MKTISSAATAASATCRTAAPSRTSRRVPPSRPRIRSMSRSTAAASSWCRPPAGERYTRDGGLQINNQGQLVTAAGNPVLGTSGPIVFQPTDHDITIAADGNVTVLEGTNRIDSVRGKLRLVSFADAQKLLKEGSNLYSAGDGAAAQPDTTLDGAAGLHRKVQRQLGRRDEPHDRGDAHLHADRDPAAAAERPAQIRDRKTRRRSGIRKTDPCARSIPQRPEWRHRNSTFR